ncbi:MAG TPA: hypothetical protein VIJ18_17800 [Microbacteriaceae bacterium]
MRTKNKVVLNFGLALLVGATLAGTALSPAVAASTPLPAVPNFQSAVPAAAAAGGFANRLSAWYQSDGVVYVGITHPTGHELAALRTKFGHNVQVFAEPQFSTMVKRTPIVHAPALVHRSGPAKPNLARTAVGAQSVSPATTTPGNYPPFIDSAPYWGGDRIVSTQGQYIVQCTVTGAYGNGAPTYMMTAGHCGPTGTVWDQGYYDGTNIQYSGTMGTDVNTSWGNNRIDGELLSGNSYGTYVWTGSNSALAVAGIGRVTPGSSICTDGSFTGHTCGATVASVNTCANINDNGTNFVVCGLDIANANVRVVQAGDSGGPVLTGETSTSTQIAGSISAGSSDGLQVLFTDSGRQSDVFGVTPAS